MISFIQRFFYLCSQIAHNHSVHEKSKPYVCEHCGYKTTSQSTLNAHNRVNSINCTLGARIPNILIPNPFKNRNFQSSIFKWLKFKMAAILFSFRTVQTIQKPNHGLPRSLYIKIIF